MIPPIPDRRSPRWPARIHGNGARRRPIGPSIYTPGASLPGPFRSDPGHRLAKAGSATPGRRYLTRDVAVCERSLALSILFRRPSASTRLPARHGNVWLAHNTTTEKVVTSEPVFLILTTQVSVSIGKLSRSVLVESMLAGPPDSNLSPGKQGMLARWVPSDRGYPGPERFLYGKCRYSRRRSRPVRRHSPR